MGAVDPEVKAKKKKMRTRTHPTQSQSTTQGTKMTDTHPLPFPCAFHFNCILLLLRPCLDPPSPTVNSQSTFSLIRSPFSSLLLLTPSPSTPLPLHNNFCHHFLPFLVPPYSPSPPLSLLFLLRPSSFFTLSVRSGCPPSPNPYLLPTHSPRSSSSSSIPSPVCHIPFQLISTPTLADPQ